MTEPVFAETAATGQRWYVLPSGEKFMSVTTALSHLARFGLLDWAAKLAAEAAAEHTDRLVAAAEHDPCRVSATADACGLCRDCVVAWLANRHNEYRDAAGDRGTRLHQATAHLDVFGDGGQVDADIEPLFANYRDWLAYYQPEIVATDATVVSRKWGYAGSLDKIVRFGDDSRLPKAREHLRGRLCVLDEKTGKHVGLVEGWQVVAYAHADAILLPDGTEEPMPDITGGLIIHNRPERIQTREVHVTDTAIHSFIHVLRAAEAMAAPLGSVVSRPFNIPKGSK